MILNTAMADFLAVSAANAPSPHSQRQYQMVLRRFAAFAGEEAAVTPELVLRYLASLRGAGLADASVAAHDRVLRVFFRRGVDLGWWGVDPMRLVRRPRRGKRAPKAIGMDTLGAMAGRAFVEVLHGSVRGVRDLALLLFLADTGCRAGEVATLGCVGLDLGRGVAVVEGKGRQSRAVLFGDVAGGALGCWLDVRGQLGLGGETVFCGLSGKGALTASGVSQVLHQLAVRAGVGDRRHRAHSLRHLFATSYVAENGDIDGLMRILGHSQLSTTQVYVGADPTVMRRKHANGSPLKRLSE